MEKAAIWRRKVQKLTHERAQASYKDGNALYSMHAWGGRTKHPELVSMAS